MHPRYDAMAIFTREARSPGAHGSVGSMAGYSGTPLARKLGIRDHHQVGLVAAPEGFTIEGVNSERLGDPSETSGAFDVLVAFSTTRADLARALTYRSMLGETGGLWLAWPKRSSAVPTELNREIVRAEGLATGLVDNKVCAIDETWSGLRFVVRVADRTTPR